MKGDPTFGVVVPVGPGREENLAAVMGCLAAQSFEPRCIVLVCDGADAWLDHIPGEWYADTMICNPPKHQPGQMQPRNYGAHAIEAHFSDVTHLAFLDSDVLVGEGWLEAYRWAIRGAGARGIYIGPYEFMPPGIREIREDLKLDLRWPMFEASPPGLRYRGDLSKGLACWSGNLVWNLEDFQRVGGFWNEIHHGACEDGELGLRAVAMNVPIGLVPEARGWHLYHGGDPKPTPEWLAYRTRINTIDVPKLQARHPWVELGNGGKELFVVEEDGKRFNARCECGAEMNTALIWQHEVECPTGQSGILGS